MGGIQLKKITVAFTLTILSLAIFLPLILNTQIASAQNMTYSITKVDHKVEVLYSGNIIISDTLQISGQLPETFQIGFPNKYAAYFLKGLAYDSNLQSLPLTIGMQLQGESTFYGARLTLPSGTPQTFTVVFIFTNNLLTPTTSGFSIDFPTYPTLTTAASQVVTTLDLPIGASNVKINKPDGAINSTSFNKNNLAAFSSSMAVANFSSVGGYIQKVTIPTLDRQINISPSGEVFCTDTYKLISNATNSISSFKINLSFNATNIVGRNQLGTLPIEIQDSTIARAANVSLTLPINPEESGLITLEYNLPSVSTQSGQFILDLDLFPSFDYYVESASVTVVTPEGAQIVNPQLNSLSSSSSLTREAFQETLAINKEGVSYIDSIVPLEDITTVAFNYNPLWISFRPSTWMWTLAIVGSVVVAVYKRPKAPKTKTHTPKIIATTVKTEISNEQVKAFTGSYEEKKLVNAEIASLEARAQKGRIPRQKYKAKRKKLELRLESLNNTISNLGALMRSTGGSYEDINRQLENAEAELEKVEQTIKIIQTRQSTGELSIEDYRKQLTDLEKRKEKVENKINGLLLRLR